MRFVAAQFNALLEHDLWLVLAGHANGMAGLLHTAMDGVAGVDPGPEPVVNSMFPTLRPDAIETLQAWSFFWDWDRSRHQVRWMTAWDTDPDDVATFATGVREIVARSN
jgi:threonine aldolase